MKQPATEDDRVWRALSDGRRRQMLDRLAEAPMTTGELVSEFEPLCRTAVMKHLEVLVAAGVDLRLDQVERFRKKSAIVIDLRPRGDDVEEMMLEFVRTPEDIKGRVQPVDSDHSGFFDGSGEVRPGDFHPSWQPVDGCAGDRAADRFNRLRPL